MSARIKGTRRRRRPKRENKKETALSKEYQSNNPTWRKGVVLCFLGFLSYWLIANDIIFNLSVRQQVVMKLMYRTSQFIRCRSFLKKGSILESLIVCVAMAFTGNTIVRILLGQVPSCISDINAWKYVFGAYALVFLLPYDLLDMYLQNPAVQTTVSIGVAIHKFLDQVAIVGHTIAGPAYFTALLCTIDLAASGVVLKIARSYMDPYASGDVVTKEFWRNAYPGLLCFTPLVYATGDPGYMVAVMYLLLRFSYESALSLFGLFFV